MFLVYVLENPNTNFYIGYTTSLKRRFKEHNLKKNTAAEQGTWQCIYYEACTNEKDARRRERYLKTTQGGRMLKRRLKEYLFERRAN